MAYKFNTKYDFPHTLGCIDGKHFRIQAPSNSGSYFFNYKGYFSIVLMAVVDADANFIYIDVGSNGRNSDGGVWDECSLSTALENKTLNLPAAERLSDAENAEVPYVFLADEAFPLKSYLLKPYPGRGITPQKMRFNYHLSRARQVVERAFGLLAQRFRLFRGSIQCSPETCDSVIKTACVLHNWLNIINVPQQDVQEVPFDPLPASLRTASQRSARNIRDAFSDHFSRA